MPRTSFPFPAQPFLTLFLLLLGLMGCSASQPTKAPSKAPVMPQIRLDPPSVSAGSGSNASYPVLLGIDVLEQNRFKELKGKKVGLLTHPAGVNRRGETTIEVLRRAPGLKLEALYGPEHGIYGKAPAEVPIANSIDPKTGLPVFSLYGRFRKPTKDMLKGLDALVIDLQDIGTRSYTYVSAMKETMGVCFEQNIEVVVLDRPNPLGGLKVDGPLLDPAWRKGNYVGAFPVPYVHGLTIGELAQLAKGTPGVLEIPEGAREKGRLTVIPMRGWRRSMRWPDTGLKWVPTSPRIPDFQAVLGYPMTGLGTYLGSFKHGVGEQYPFRGLYHPSVRGEQLEKELRAFKIPGLDFRKITVPKKDGSPGTGLYIDIVDFDAWRPTELSFYLMKLSSKWDNNPFRSTPQGQANGFLRHMGNTAFFESLKQLGFKVDVPSFLQDCAQRTRIYQQQSKRFWLYPN